MASKCCFSELRPPETSGGNFSNSEIGTAEVGSRSSPGKSDINRALFSLSEPFTLISRDAREDENLWSGWPLEDQL